MQPIEALLVLVSLSLLGWGSVAIFLAAWRWLFGSKPDQPAVEEDEDGNAMAVATRPVQMPGGQWMHRVFKWEPCEAPIVQGELVVHNRKDPEHVKQCAECRDGLKPRYPGVSHRSN